MRQNRGDTKDAIPEAIPASRGEGRAGGGGEVWGKEKFARSLLLGQNDCCGRASVRFRTSQVSHKSDARGSQDSQRSAGATKSGGRRHFTLASFFFGLKKIKTGRRDVWQRGVGR